MSIIGDKIEKIFPEIVKEESGLTVYVVPFKQMPQLAEYLYEEKDLQFDTLKSIIGVDWGETLGAVYILESSIHNTSISLKVETSDRENPLLYSVSNIWRSADLNEREIFDFYGIRFIGHPDMRRLFLREDWVGYPLRKDYDASPQVNPVPTTNEENADTTIWIEEGEDGKINEIVRNIFEPTDYVVNIGPQHPATHGVLRFRTAIEGETIRKIDLHCGYIHRGIERICEESTYPQTLHFTDRLDYLSAHQNRHALCMCIEEAAGIEVPERAKYIRTIMDELTRIQSHLLFYGTFCMDLGATSALFYAFREREKVLDILEDTCGARLTMNYNKIGGVMKDIHPQFVEKVKAFIADMPARLKEYHTLFTGNIIAHNRMEKVGVLTKFDAINYGVTGPSGRASGWACDVRKTAPYGVYDRVKFEQVILEDGDTYSRYMVRMREIEQSLSIIEQLIDNIPEGDYAAKTKAVIKLPAGRYYKQVEASRGAFGVYIESKGDKFPYRLKFSSPGLPLVGVIDYLTRGTKIADLIAIGGSLDYVVPDIDR